MSDPVQFRVEIVRPALQILAAHSRVPYSRFAEDLLMATAAQESRFGWYFVQNYGPAKTIYQIEPATFAGVWKYLSGTGWEPVLAAFRACGIPSAEDALTYAVGDLSLATMFARVNYWRQPTPLPAKTNRDTLWEYYKTFWNTKKGAATETEFILAVNALTDMKI